MTGLWARESISLVAALGALQAAISAAEGLGLIAAIVVADETGRVKVLALMDGATAFKEQAAHDKAHTAACTGMPTSAWDALIDGDELTAIRYTSAIERLCILPGGIPLLINGKVVGAIGVSAGTDQQDVEIAEAAATSMRM